jgi:hypothetical protein
METVDPLFRARLTTAWGWTRRHQNVLIFIGGFLFDAVTLRRIDSWMDLMIQLAYLLGLTGLIVGQHKESTGLWHPSGRIGRVWAYNTEVLHFFYGGLLSNYVVLYAKSTAGPRALGFFSLLVALLFLNEMPALRRFGHRLRLGLYAFCVASFLIYFIPILAGRMGDALFVLSLALSAGVVWGMTALLTRQASLEERRARRLRLAWPAGAVLLVIALLHVLRLIPPVPLSVQFDGIYHAVEREEGVFSLRSEKPSLRFFWRRDSRPFRQRAGDRVYYFARIFAPARFRQRVVIHWERRNEADGAWSSYARVPVTVTGGREEGYRGYSFVEGLNPGRWRAGVETEDGRVVGRRSFILVADARTGERRWRRTKM